jgi:hypothetical protein
MVHSTLLLGMSVPEPPVDHSSIQKKILYKLKMLVKIGTAAKALTEDSPKNALALMDRTIVLPLFYTRFWNQPSALDPQPAETWRYLRNNKQFNRIIANTMGITIEGPYHYSTGIDQTRLTVKACIKDEQLIALGRFKNRFVRGCIFVNFSDVIVE